MDRWRRTQVSIPVNSDPDQSKALTAMGLWPDAGQTTRALRVRNRDRERIVPLSELDAVIECPPVTPVPAAPGWLLGVAAHKGALLSVIDLGTACGDPGVGLEPGERLLLVETAAHRLAFSVDAILSESTDAKSGDGAGLALRALASRLLGAEPVGGSGLAESAAT